MHGTRLGLAAAALLSLSLSSAASAQPRTDIIVLGNGDRITGEIVRLERGRLELKTDDIGTLQIEWDNVARLEAIRTFEIVTERGDRMLGRLAPSPAVRELTIAGDAGVMQMPMGDVAQILPIGTSLWKKLDGTFDAGFNYSKSSGVGQLNVNSNTIYRRPAFEGRLRLSLAATRKDEGGKDDRGYIDASYVRYRWPRWYVSGATRFERDESLGLQLRSQLAAMVGPRLVNSTRAKLALAGGLAANNERNIDASSRRSLEAVAGFYASYFTYDRPRTDIDISLRYFRSLSESRRRVQFEAWTKREVWKDFYVGLNGYDSYDSVPANPRFDSNDLGVTFSVGWSY